jgi:hypothetical protein
MNSPYLDLAESRVLFFSEKERIACIGRQDGSRESSLERSRALWTYEGALTSLGMILGVGIRPGALAGWKLNAEGWSQSHPGSYLSILRPRVL